MCWFSVRCAARGSALRRRRGPRRLETRYSTRLGCGTARRLCRDKVTYITLASRGNKLAMYKGYSFCRNNFKKYGTCYKCSNFAGKNCKAYITVDSEDYVVKAVGHHYHDPYKYIRMSSGQYLRL
ncbi:Modifier of mdg4 [Operophtera brumata]|uniref:Modifier of mdg4 n=1 Tax=Operophtera brumata TaxID=104452 RepID=A0A0L7KU18_OPEBR|nr:Modifier of mdg4 [Operophtera brumata]